MCSIEEYVSNLLNFGTIYIEFYGSKIVGLVSGYIDNLDNNLSHVSNICGAEKLKK